MAWKPWVEGGDLRGDFVACGSQLAIDREPMRSARSQEYGIDGDSPEQAWEVQTVYFGPC